MTDAGAWLLAGALFLLAAYLEFLNWRDKRKG